MRLRERAERWRRRTPGRSLGDLSVRTKVLLAPLAAIVMLAVLTLTSGHVLDRQRAIFLTGVQQKQPELTLMLSLPERLAQAKAALYRLSLWSGIRGGAAEAGEALAASARALEQASADVAALERAELSGARMLRRRFNGYRDSVVAARRAIRRGEPLGAATLRRTERLYDDLTRHVSSMAARAGRDMSMMAREAELAATRLARLVLLVALVGAVIVLAVGSFSSRSIVVPLELLLGSIRSLRRGDLGETILMTERRDELGEVARAMARFREILIDRRKLEEERERRREELDRMAHHDPLTGLANRSSIHGFLARAFAERRRENLPLALFVVDLDGFKPTNDTYGHAAGDAVLVEIARRLGEVIRVGDLAARTGGDEFAIAFARVQTREDVARLAERVTAIFDAPVEWDGRSLVIGGSIGAALAADNDCDAGALFAAADEAMYAAKSDPGTSWKIHVPPEQAVQAARCRHELAEVIQRQNVLARYQPVVRLADGAHTGYIVHLLWHHPARGIVPVREFLPEVERAGLVGEMTAAGFRRLLASVTVWLDAGLEPGWTSIVPPAAMLLSPGAMHDLDRLLSEFPAAAARLEIEVPESFVEGRAERAVLRSLRRLRVRQVRTAIGGFGRRTGSLALLDQGAFDEVRISGTVVARSDWDREARVLIKGLLGVAEGLGLDVLARGVETVEQARRLRRLGCRFATGSRYGPPLEAEVAEEWMRRLALRCATAGQG